MVETISIPQNLANEISFSVIGRYFPSSYSKAQISSDIADRNKMKQLLMSMSFTSTKFTRALDTFISLLNQIIPDFKSVTSILDINEMISSRIDKITTMIEQFTTNAKQNPQQGGAGGFGGLMLAGGIGSAALMGMNMAGQMEAAGGPVNPSVLPVSADLPPEGKAVLAAIASVESPGYNAINYVAVSQGYPKYVNDLSKHPFEGQKGYTAAGKYQILASNWAKYAPMAGVSDFKPESQDKVAWLFAQDVYQRQTGRSLIDDVKNPEMHASIVQTLAPTWHGMGANFQKSLSTLSSVYKTSSSSALPPSQPSPTNNIGEIPAMKEGGMIPDNSNPFGTLALLHPGELVVPKSKLPEIANAIEVEQDYQQNYHTEFLPIIVYA